LLAFRLREALPVLQLRETLPAVHLREALRMAFQLDDLTDVKASPASDAPNLVVQGGTLFGTGKRVTDTNDANVEWINVYIPPGMIDGWVKSTEGKEVPDPEPAPLDPEMFVRQCTLIERSMNTDPAVAPNFVTADFLIARAIIESGMTQAVFQPPYYTGPFRLHQDEWDAFMHSELKVKADDLFKAADAKYPMFQVYAAGHALPAAGKAFAARWIAANPQDQEFVPSYLDLFHTYLTDAPTAVAIRVNESAAPPKPLSELVNEAALATINSRKSLSQIKGSMTVREFVAETEALLTSTLNAAFDKIKTLAADELPKATTGAANSTPWFAEARKQLADDISETKNPDRIRTYFDATDHGSVGGTIPPWCGAFAAFCMKSSASPVPKGSALAASWKSWGSRSLPVGSNDIPVGAVVVLTPSEGTRGSGHVGFFSKFSPDAKKIELLGGNQSDAVKFSQFPITRVAAIRVLEDTMTASSGAATNHFNLTAAGVPKERHKWGDLIVDRFQRAGFTQDHHLRTALANAIDESRLNPEIKAAGSEESYGLFQCNQRGGLGTGFTVKELRDPDTNISIILKAARGSKAFCSASSLAAAMDAFVRHIERPANPEVAISRRTDIANLL